MRDYQKAVFFGRFQPIHNEHVQVIRRALEIADELILVIGSYRVAPSLKNPFTFEERVQMIRSTIPDNDLSRVHIVPVRDYYYSDNLWLAEVQQKLSAYLQPGDAVALMGAYKDASSYYLDYFRTQWTPELSKQTRILCATDIRHKMFHLGGSMIDPEYNPYQAPKELRKEVDASFTKDLPEGVVKWLTENFYGTKRYHDLMFEYQFIQHYISRWKSAPFPPTFVTADAVVVQSGHVLVVRRKFSPGKGLWALPGGFIRQNELIRDAAIRELREETGIDIPRAALADRVRESHVFDYPGRSLRGRTVTHAYYLNLGGGELPRIRANSDADVVQWMALTDVHLCEDKFFEDHYHIINYFLTRNT